MTASSSTHHVTDSLAGIFGERVIAFRREFLMFGGIKVALFLSQAFYWSKACDHGWWWKTQAEWEAETGLTRREQESVRKALRGRGLLMEKRSGVPARLHFRLNLDAIFSALMAHNSQSARDGHTRLHATDTPDCTKPPRQIARNRQSNTEKTPENTTEKIPPHSPPQGKSSSIPSGVQTTVSEPDAASPTKNGQTFSAAHGGRVPREWMAAAIERGLTPQDAAKEAEGFQDYWTGTKPRTKRKRWKATWMQWIRKHPRYRPDASIVAEARAAAAQENGGQGLFDGSEQDRKNSAGTEWAGNILSDL